MKKPQKPDLGPRPASTAAPYEVQRAQRQTQNLLTIFQTLFLATKGVFWPDQTIPRLGTVDSYVSSVCFVYMPSSRLWSRWRFRTSSAADAETGVSAAALSLGSALWDRRQRFSREAFSDEFRQERCERRDILAHTCFLES
jgi:hypothetical protein